LDKGALTHAAYDALSKKAKEGGVAPRCFRSQKYLAEMDKGWTTIMMPDDTGFMVSVVMNTVSPDEHSAVVDIDLYLY
jgi:hypothetical protein